MPRAPFAVTALVVIAAAARSAALTIDPEPFAADAGAVLAATFLVFALIAATGLLVARGPWARVLGFVITAGSLGLAVAGRFDVIGVFALAAAGLALAGLAGPWLTRRWLRLLPSADGPPPLAVATVLCVLAFPGWVAVVRPSGLDPADWTLVGLALALALGLNRAFPLALWSVRMLLPIAGIIVGIADGMPGGLLIAVGAAAVAGLAWSPTVGRSVVPLVAAPSAAVPIPPELVSPELLEAAGYDERGRRLKST